MPRMGKRFRRGKGNQHTPNGYAKKKWKRVRAAHQLCPPSIKCLTELIGAKQRRTYRRILNRFVKAALSAQAARTEGEVDRG